MRVMTENTDVPVPKVLDTWFDEYDGRIVVDFVPGTRADVIGETLNDDEKQRFVRVCGPKSRSFAKYHVLQKSMGSLLALPMEVPHMIL